MADAHTEHDLHDGLGPEGPYHRQAYVWFVGAVVFSFALTYVLSGIDRKLYDTKNPYLDEKMYHENRMATTLVTSERNDERKAASYSVVASELAPTAAGNASAEHHE